MENIIHKLLDYEPETGHLFWRPRTPDLCRTEQECMGWNRRYAGKRCFKGIEGNGYHLGTIYGKSYYAHRVIWLMQTGEWPEQIDHINGVRTDNRFHNLRNVTHLGNGRNQRMNMLNTSGVVGVCWDKRHQKWRARIKINGRNKQLGQFSDFNEAVKVRKDAERQHGFHPNHGT